MEFDTNHITASACAGIGTVARRTRVGNMIDMHCVGTHLVRVAALMFIVVRYCKTNNK